MFNLRKMSLYSKSVWKLKESIVVDANEETVKSLVEELNNTVIDLKRERLKIELTRYETGSGFYNEVLEDIKILEKDLWESGMLYERYEYNKVLIHYISVSGDNKNLVSDE